MVSLHAALGTHAVLLVLGRGTKQPVSVSIVNGIAVPVAHRQPPQII